MNYPIWDIPGGGLLIAGVAILHVFIAHFAVGGGLFLVVTERKARRDGDAALLAYVRRHSRFFVLLTLVLGAITGVGIWFTIGLVHPQGTSALITVFVWAWAIEWTFFAAEIAAALVYYYGWDRLSPRTHVRVGWFYFWNAWLSLAVINGILSFMLTPGDWLTTRSVWDGFLNPTYWPSLVARTAAAAGIAGLYALFTASWMADRELKARLARYAGLGWVLPAVAIIPLSLGWYFAAAAGAGVPVRELYGAATADLGGYWTAIVSGSATGYPLARYATLAMVLASVTCLAVTAVIVFLRPDRYGRLATSVLLAGGFVLLGGSEWVREAIRKPWVIGQYMFVNAVRLPPPDGIAAGIPVDDRFTVDAINRTGVLVAANWVRLPEADSTSAFDHQLAEGREIFRLQCWSCHTFDGHQAIRPLVTGRTVAALDGMLARLAQPVDAEGQATGWDAPGLRLVTWRGRHMTPFVGTDTERRALAMYLAGLGGLDEAAMGGTSPGAGGAAVFDEHCAMCHGPDSAWPAAGFPSRSVADLHDLLGRLDEVNEMMAPFAGAEAERRGLAEFLAGGAVTEPAEPGATLFDEHCAMCHGPDGAWPLADRPARSAAELYDLLGRLAEVNEMMPPFEGSDDERRALAEYLAETVGRTAPEAVR